MLTVFFRAALLFGVAVLSMRSMGKRQVGQLQPFELVVAIMIAELAATPMENVGTPLLYGIVPMMTLVVLHSVLTIAGMKSQRLRGLICGRPSVLISHGEIQRKELERLCYNLNDLTEELRNRGMLNPADVCTAVLETSGKMSVFPHANKRPVTPEDLHLPVDYEGIPLTLVLDGQVQQENLRIGGLNESWLQKQLLQMGFDRLQTVLLCSLDTQGKLFVQSMGTKPRMQIKQVLAPEQIGW